MTRRLSLLLVPAAVALFAGAPSASATTTPTNCANFGTTLASAGAGDTIVLSGMCTGADAHFTLPATANLTIEGASSGTNGFNGTGVASPALASAASPNDPNGLTLRNLTFENYSSSAAVEIVTQHVGNPYAVVGDTFSNNSNPSSTSDGGGLNLQVFNTAATSCTVSGPIITISGSTFTGNSAIGSSFVTGGGGGAFLDLECPSGSASMSVTGNTFTGNTVNAPGANSREGGGLLVATGHHLSFAVQVALSQSGNLFQGNRVTGSGGDYGGGGEFTAGAHITSRDDRFLGNSLPGSAASTVSSEGGGLGTRSGGSCTTPSSVKSTATNLVAAGNTIGGPSGTGTGGEGAGVYAGCGIGSGGYNLTLVNSTVTGNQATGSGAVAGADGEATDALTLQNTILTGNPGGADLGGFGATDGANVTAAYSDVCAIGASTPFAGAGNICADPKLVNAAIGDVHQTPSSPTVDRGLNSVVTTTTDVYGDPRITAGKPGDAPTVDIGASELPSDAFTIGGLQGLTLFVDVTSPGTVLVTQAGAQASALAVTAKKHKKKRKKKLLLRPSSATGGPGTVAVRLQLTKFAKKILKRKRKLKIPATVTFTPNGGIPNSQQALLKIKKKKHKHKKKH